MTETILNTDAAADVAGALRQALRSAEATEDDPQAWTWVLRALHAALQGACICHLTRTAEPLGAVTEKNAKEWVAWFDASRDQPDLAPPATRLMPLPDLLKAIRKPGSAGDGRPGAGIELSGSELAWLTRIHREIRNPLTHFALTSWSIDLTGVPALARLIARIIGAIAARGWAFRHMEPEDRMDLDHSLVALASWR